MAQVTLRLKELMKAEGITQTELSKKTKIPQGTLSRWYQNKVDKYDRRIINALCDFFDIEPGELIVRKK